MCKKRIILASATDVLITLSCQVDNFTLLLPAHFLPGTYRAAL